MKNKLTYIVAVLFALLGLQSCAVNDLAEYPKDANFPFRLVLDTDKGGDLPDAEDYALEIKFADFIGALPRTPISVDFEISDLTGDMAGTVEIDEIIYEDKDGEEHSLDFTLRAGGRSGTIFLNAPVTGMVPAEFEVVFKLPGEEGVFFATGSFKFALSNLQAGGANVVLGSPREFTYEVLDHELAGSWKFEIDDEAGLTILKEAFGVLNADLRTLGFSDIMPGEPVEVEIEFEFEEVKLVIVYIDRSGEEVEIEIEGEYDFDDGEIKIEGSHLVFAKDGQIEGELDFLLEGAYDISGDVLTMSVIRIIDEDNYKPGKELLLKEHGIAFEFEKD